LFTDGRVSGEDSDVECGGVFAAGGDPIGYGPGRFSVGALHGCGNALGDLRLGQGIRIEAFE